MIDHDILARIKARDAAAAAPTPREAQEQLTHAVRRAFFETPTPPVDVAEPGGLQRAVAAALGLPAAPSDPQDAPAGAPNPPAPPRALSVSAKGKSEARALLAELEAWKAQLGDIALRLHALEERSKGGR